MHWPSCILNFGINCENWFSFMVENMKNIFKFESLLLPGNKISRFVKVHENTWEEILPCTFLFKFPTAPCSYRFAYALQ